MVKDQYDPVLIHENILSKMREDESTLNCSDRILLMSVFQNYRTGAGLRLSKTGYDFCLKNELYEFVCFEYANQPNSNFFSSLDRVSAGPYYVENSMIYICDTYLASLAYLYDKDFFRVFEVFS